MILMVILGFHTFDTDDVRRSVGKSPQDFAKFFSSRRHVTLCGTGDTDGVKRYAHGETRRPSRRRGNGLD
jgi:hypothetical protein